MAKYLVKAFFMHEKEEAAARIAEDRSVISNAEWTPGYVMGVVDESEFDSLAKQGLVVSAVEKIAPQRRAAKRSLRDRKRSAGEIPAAGDAMVLPGVFALNAPLALSANPKRPLATVSPKAKPSEKILSADRKKSQFYVVRFHGPLTPERSAQLAKGKYKPLERVSRNKYTMELAPAQLDGLAALSFVDTVRLYTGADTFQPTRRGVLAPVRASKGGKRKARSTKGAAAEQKRQVTCVYVVQLHRAKSMPQVVTWLAKRKRKVLWKGKDLLRVLLIRDGKDVRALSNLPAVSRIDEVRQTRAFDGIARGLLRIENGSASVGLEGKNEIIGIADTGLDASHPDFQGRVVGVAAWGRKNNTSDPEGHGTHVAGCALGDGTSSHGAVKGAAPKAGLFFQSILDGDGRLGGLPEDLADLFDEAYAKGVRIHNNSWGAFAFARYTSASLQVDRFVADHPDMLIVIAAGNDGIGVPREQAVPMHSALGYVDWPSVAAPATSKNGLTVGASRNDRSKGGYASLTWGDVWSERYPHKPIAGETISGKPECLAAFSSRGPCDDLRTIKPEVVAPGTDIAATKSKDAPLRKFWGAYPGSDKYAFMGGTSMAAPYVAGCAALVREWYRKNGHAEPSAALLKATLINGTRRLTGSDSIAAIQGDPNHHQGFGRIDMANTVPNPIEPKLGLVFDDTWQTPARQLTQINNRLRYQVQVGSKLPLRICLSWTDPPAHSLQNELLLLVDNGGSTKWVGNAGAARLLTITLSAGDNNTQVVRIAKPQAATYTIVVTASNLLQQKPQAFALVVTGDLKSPLRNV